LAKEIKTGAFFVNELSHKEFKALCAYRPTTQNSYARIKHEDVIQAAKEIAGETKEAFLAWIREEPAAK